MMIPAWREMAIAKAHDRSGFDCGQDNLNTFLTRHARQSHVNGLSKTYVAVDAADFVTVYGFYTVCPAEMQLDRIPPDARPKGGRHPLSGFRLARLAVRKTLQGQGLGGQLFAAAAFRCIRVSEEMGGTALMIDAKDEAAADWYATYGALPLIDDPLSLVLPYHIFRNNVAAAGQQT